MRFLCVGLLLISTILSKGRSEDFQCYVCEDCSKVTDADLKKCDQQTGSTTTTTTELPPGITKTTTTTEPPEKSTTSTTTTTTTTEPSTQPAKNTTTSTTTTTTTTEPSTQPAKNTTTSTTTTTTTTEPSTQPAKNTTTSTTTTTTTTTEPSTQPAKNTTTSTTTTTTTTEPSTQPAKNTTEPSEVSPPKDSKATLLAREIAVDERNELREAYLASIQSALHRARQSIRANGPSCHCFSIQVKDGDAFKWKRGKITVNDGENACKKLTAENSGSKNCKSCQKDKCNSSAALQFSFVTLLAILAFSFFA